MDLAATADDSFHEFNEPSVETRVPKTHTSCELANSGFTLLCACRKATNSGYIYG